MKTALFLVLWALAVPGWADDMLRADSVVCETEDQLPLLRNPDLDRKPGSAVFKRLDEMIEFYTLLGKAQRFFADTAVREEAIRSGYGIGGTTSARQADAQARANQADADKAAVEHFKLHCMPVPDATSVKVITHRPISGEVRIAMTLNGVQTEVWTMAYFLENSGSNYRELPPPRTSSPAHSPAVAAETTSNNTEASPTSGNSFWSQHRAAASSPSVDTSSQLVLVQLPQIDIEAHCLGVRNLVGSAFAQTACLDTEYPAREWLKTHRTTRRIAEYCARSTNLMQSYFAGQACVQTEESAERRLGGQR